MAGSATASPKSHVSSSQHTRTSSQLSRYGGDFSSDEDGTSPRGSRRSTRSPKAGAARARTGSHAQLHARGVSKSTGVRLSQQQLGASASVPTLSGGIAQPSDRARIQGVASTTSLLPGVRMAPLPTAGLRHLRVPLPVYNTMTQQGSALLLNSGHDPKNPRLLRRLPIFSASTTALASTAGGGGGGGVAKLLGMPDVSRRRRSSVAEEATIERHDISSLTDRLSMLYSTADAADAAADAASTTVASDAGALGAHIVPLDASQSMETLGVSEKGTAPHQPASERRPLPSLVAAETVRGGHVSGAAAASAGDSVAARRRMKANLTYQSPLEKAHDDILAAWDARVAKTMEEIIRGTQGQDLDAPHGTLPSFWPDDAGLSRPAPSLATSDAAVTNLGPAGAVSEDASTGSRQRGRRSSLSLVQAVGSGSASPVRPHTGMVPSPSSMSLSRSPSPTSWRAANSGYLPANNATAAPARARMW
ncbi:MAG: hypothetical protein EOO41_02230 [Methanobacteriota archaeon]|nr:MAG: hypothetical protein EOO41_02230 [Euryarchaeota archaeon]